MALCDPSGTSIAAGSGIVVSGSGTPGDPWLISATDPVDIAAIESDIADINVALATASSTYVKKAQDVMNGPLSVVGPVHDKIRLYKGAATDWAYTAFYNENGDQRLGYCGVAPTPDNHVHLASDTTGDVVFSTEYAERMRVATSSVLVGKSTNDPNVPGVALYPVGGISLSSNTDVWNVIIEKNTPASSFVGAVFAMFRSNLNAVGTIQMNGAASIAYNTTSDRDLKENVAPIDDELALLWMRSVEPVFFNFKVEPEVQQVGYIAQDVAEVWPDAISNGLVSPGYGDINDRTWDAEGRETTHPEAWMPWMFNYGRLTPFLHASIQALDRLTMTQQATIDAQAAQIDAQAAQIADLTARLEAVELAIKPK